MQYVYRESVYRDASACPPCPQTLMSVCPQAPVRRDCPSVRTPSCPYVRRPPVRHVCPPYPQTIVSVCPQAPVCRVHRLSCPSVRRPLSAVSVRLSAGPRPPCPQTIMSVCPQAPVRRVRRPSYPSAVSANRHVRLSAGPCPPCPQTVAASCFCRRRAAVSRRCGDAEWSCGERCQRPLACHQHNCQAKCHKGNGTIASVTPPLIKTE